MNTAQMQERIDAHAPKAVAVDEAPDKVPDKAPDKAPGEDDAGPDAGENTDALEDILTSGLDEKGVYDRRVAEGIVVEEGTVVRYHLQRKLEGLPPMADGKPRLDPYAQASVISFSKDVYAKHMLKCLSVGEGTTNETLHSWILSLSGVSEELLIRTDADDHRGLSYVARCIYQGNLASSINSRKR